MDPKNSNSNSKDKIMGQAPMPVFQGLNAYGKPVPQPAVNPFEQPVVQPGIAQPIIVVNQVVTVNTEARTYTPYATVCPYCKKKVTTVPVKHFNCGTCLLCYFTGLLFYICFQLIRQKELCCFDALHKCPNCRQTISTYQSC